jgi:hypothetical protein
MAGYSYKISRDGKKIKCKNKMLRRKSVEELAKAWMAYIDYLGLVKYRPQQFRDKTIGKTEYCRFGDKLFTHGERSVISRYLKGKGLVSIDRWKYYKVKWRDEEK